MKKITTVLLVFSLFLPTTILATELNLFNWEDSIAPEILDDYYEKTGTKINVIFYDSELSRDEIVASPRGENFDLIVMDSVAAQILGKNNILTAINEKDVRNIKNIDPYWTEVCGNFGSPYLIGTTGIVYDTTKVNPPPTSWGDLLHPAPENQGHVAMIEDLVDLLLPPLLYSGHNVNSEKTSELKQAYQLLVEQIPFVLNYTYSLTNINIEGVAENMHMALGYNGDEDSLNDITETENWAYIIPKEGTVLWVDCMTVNASSNKQEQALDFLNYLNEVEVSAKNTEYLYSPPVIVGVKQFLPPEMVEDTSLFPSYEELNKRQMHRILSDETLRQRKRIIDSLFKRYEAQ